MERSTRHEMLMEMAEVVAKRGTCDRLHVGCVIARDGRIIATGYNGAPAGLPHCDHSYDVPVGYVMPNREITLDEAAELFSPMAPGKVVEIDFLTHQVKSVGCTRAVHAEANTIAFAARHGLALEGATLYVTHMPCENCAKLIVNAGLSRVVYKHPYRLTAGVELLRMAKIRVFASNELE